VALPSYVESASLCYVPYKSLTYVEFDDQELRFESDNSSELPDELKQAAVSSTNVATFSFMVSGVTKRIVESALSTLKTFLKDPQQIQVKFQCTDQLVNQIAVKKNEASIKASGARVEKLNTDAIAEQTLSKQGPTNVTMQQESQPRIAEAVMYQTASKRETTLRQLLASSPTKPTEDNRNSQIFQFQSSTATQSRNDRRRKSGTNKQEKEITQTKAVKPHATLKIPSLKITKVPAERQSPSLQKRDTAEKNAPSLTKECVRKLTVYPLTTIERDGAVPPPATASPFPVSNAITAKISKIDSVDKLSDNLQTNRRLSFNSSQETEEESDNPNVNLDVSADFETAKRQCSNLLNQLRELCQSTTNSEVKRITKKAVDIIQEYCDQEIQYFKQLIAATKETLRKKIENFIERENAPIIHKRKLEEIQNDINEQRKRLKESHQHLKDELKASETLLQKYEKLEWAKLFEEERQQRGKQLENFKMELQDDLLNFERSLSSLFEVSYSTVLQRWRD